MNQREPRSVRRREARAPFQFSLKHLLGVTAWWAVVCAIGVQFDVFAAVLFVLLTWIWVAFRFPRTRPFFVPVAILLFLLATLWPPVPRANVPARKAACMNRLKQIGLALHNYHQRYGCFPPAYVADESGKPIHSWRVLILPFLEQGPLYEEYSFDEPWDGPNNSKLAKHSPYAWRCPADDEDLKDEALMTSYVVVVGPETVFPGSKPTKIDDIGDGTSQTILVVEVADSGINWMEPRDLDISQMALRINPTAGQGISSKHPGGAVFCFADGSIRFLSEDLTPGTIRALLTPNGGEKVDPDEF